MAQAPSREDLRKGALIMAQNCLSAALRRTERIVTEHYDRSLSEVDLSAIQFPLLAAIGVNEDATVSQLADILDLERSTVSRDIASLARKGLIESGTGDDRRTKTVRLTSRGWRGLRDGYRAWKDAHDELLRSLGKSEFPVTLQAIRDLGRAARSK